MPGKKPIVDKVQEPERFKNLSDEELMEFIKTEGSKDASVLAKLIVIQRIRSSLVRERIWQRIMTASSIVLSIVALTVGIGGYLAFQNFLDDRVERTITACRDDANDSISHNTSIEEQVDGLYFIESLVVNPDRPEIAMFLNIEIDEQVADIRKNYQPVRDCTETGIRIYNETKGQKGYLDGPQIEQANRRPPVRGET